MTSAGHAVRGVWVAAVVSLALASCRHLPPPEIVRSPGPGPLTQTTTNAVPATTNAAIPGATNVPAALPAEYRLPYSLAEYRLSVGDLVEVSIFGVDEASVSVPIAPDGKLYYLFGDGVPAAGRRPEEVARDIQVKLTRLFNSPRVTILPRTFAASRYLVLGKVQRSGIFPLESSITLRQAIANAGGLVQGTYRGTTVEIASLRESYVVRDGQRLPVDLDALMNKHDASQDIYVRPGDIIYIASGLGSTREVYLLGEVVEQKAIGYRDNMTLIELLAGSSDHPGGYTSEANLRRVVILRGALKNPKMIDVNVGRILSGRDPDVYLMPGDLVYVAPKPFRFARSLARNIVLTFVRSFSSEAGSRFVEDSLFGATGSSVTVSSDTGSAADTSSSATVTAPDTPPR